MLPLEVQNATCLIFLKLCAKKDVTLLQFVLLSVNVIYFYFPIFTAFMILVHAGNFSRSGISYSRIWFIATVMFLNIR